MRFGIPRALITAAGCKAEAPPAPPAELPKPSAVPAEATGPKDQGPDFPHERGDIERGKKVFRTETFGVEGFWTDAMRMPEGIKKAKLTPAQALEAGLSVNVEALDAATRAALAKEVASQGARGPMMNDPKVTVKLLNANAVIGMVVVDSNHDGKLDVGKLLATAANSRAIYPLLQLSLKANGGRSLGRAPPDKGITPDSTEAEVDAYLSNPEYYPLGSFDDAPDGNGAPQHIAPFFRTDLSAPFGSPGDIAKLDNFANLAYTVLFDPTTLTTPGGRAFLHKLGGAAGDEIADNYVKVLTAARVKGPKGKKFGTGFPFVTASLPAGIEAGSEEAPVGVRVDNQKLLDLNAYTDSLPAPKAPPGLDARKVAEGRKVFSASCTACHNVDQSVRVPSKVVPIEKLLTGYSPKVLAERPAYPPSRPKALSSVQDDASTIFDDKTVVVDASGRGEVRGSVAPFLLDLARKDKFLHDSSVVGLSSLLDPSRGDKAPHAFYVTDATQRERLVEFLRSLEAN